MPIRSIDDLGAVLAWGALGPSDVIAAGTKDSGGVGFDDYGGTLSLYSLFSNDTPTLLSSVSTPSRFSSLSWSAMNNKPEYPQGLLAGGMLDGTVCIWDPEKISTKHPSPQLASIQRHTGPVNSCQFNPNDNSNHLLASCGVDTEVYVMSLDRPDAPSVFVPAPPPNTTKHTAAALKARWNSKVPHILATSSASGLTIVWDLRQKKPWCTIQDVGPTSCLEWNPSEGLHLLTASESQANIKLYDLRASTTMPLATLPGHADGVLGLSWSKWDARLLASCGKDNKTLIWDLHSLQAVHEVTLPAPDTSEGFGGIGGGNAQKKRYDVQWGERGVLSTVSFDRKVEIHNVMGCGMQSGRAPKWLSTGKGVSLNWGGKRVCWGGEKNSIVTIDEVVEREDLKAKSEVFEQHVVSKSYVDYCKLKMDQGGGKVWEFMSMIFHDNARERLVQYLGFDAAQIAESARGVSAAGMGAKETNMNPEVEESVKNALLVGDFEAAVDCCFKNGHLSDALVLSSCGGATLWQETQKRYFQSETRSYLKIVSAVINHSLMDYVESSDVTKWGETLAVLSTYAKSEEFPTLCEALGAKLDASGDKASACLTYLCALNIEKAVQFWTAELEVAPERVLALQEFVEKVTIFSQGEEREWGEVDKLFREYADMLANQGMPEVALKYVKGKGEEVNILRERINKAKIGGAVNQAPAQQPVTQQQQQPQYGQQQQQQQQQQQHNPYVQQQQQPQQQHNPYAQQQQQTQPAPTPPAQSNALPPGWIAMQDPTSGRTYYANQQTGQTTWETPHHQPQQNEAIQRTPSGGSAGTPSLANKYGDGFVSSASNPQLAAQYGNIGTANPYNGAARPAGANVAGSSSGQPHALDQQNTLVEQKPAEIPEEFKPIVESLKSITTALSATQLNGSEKKQLQECTKGCDILAARLATPNAIDPDTIAKTQTLVHALVAKDYGTAGQMSQQMANTVWKDHKDWLKGMKFLIQLCGKKL
ncbi:hypothetical protein TL16_g03004 [Triparma laevis f. inornata]|uniref:WW domain-containing protein n=1 Tax=Triparma laevis f. inornata TaxID=1714386 RepID=A0A9W6ZZM1_9STRA|nr:hypothetical protein TL16_g03004 [Triparma laevis f. inornata]